MPPIQAGNECRSDCGPRLELRTEFTAQEFLLGRNDSLVVKPEREQECDQKQQVSGGHYHAQPHQKGSEVQWVAGGGIHSAGIEYIGNLLSSISTGCSRWYEADGADTKHQSGDGNKKAAAVPWQCQRGCLAG